MKESDQERLPSTREIRFECTNGDTYSFTHWSNSARRGSPGELKKPQQYPQLILLAEVLLGECEFSAGGFSPI